MILQTIGFTKKSAKQFFETLKSNKSDLLLDIRLNNRSQLSGFTKGDDLAYFLSEICQCKYLHDLGFAPTKEILDDYRDNKISWKEYEIRYNELISSRNICNGFSERFAANKRIVFLCSEPTADKCHRRLAVEMIHRANPDTEIIHL